MKRLAALALASLVTLAVAGCSPSAPAEPSVAPTASASQVQSAPPAPSSTPTPTDEAADDADAYPVDRTAEVQAVAGEKVTLAEEVEPDRISVETTITDPRGEAGSAAAQDGIAICEAVVELGFSYVAVYEADGTTFVLAGHPSYGPDCTEV